MEHEEENANKLADLIADALVGQTPNAVMYALTIVSGNWIRKMVDERYKEMYLRRFVYLIREAAEMPIRKTKFGKWIQYWVSY